MKTYRSLKGSGTFRRILLSGHRVDGTLVQFHYVLSRPATSLPPLSFGFSISSRFFKAVERNRVRRLLREAVAKEAVPLAVALASLTQGAEVVVRLKGKSVDVKRIRFEEISKDLSSFSSLLVGRLLKE